METLNENPGIFDQIQGGNTNQALPYHTHNGTDSPLVIISEVNLNLSDVTSANVTSTKHGLAPKSPGDATKFLNGAATPDYAQVKDSDLSTSDITTNNATTSKHGLMPKGTGSTSTFYRSDMTQAAPVVTKIEITVTAGETLAIGDVVRLYKAVGNYSTDGYQMVNGTVYAVKAAANNTTYGDTVIGIVTAAASYLSSVTISIAGNATGMSGLTAGSKYYLDNYSGSSSQTITQTTSDTPVNCNGNTFTQLWVPTEGRLDTLTVKTTGNNGTLTCNVFRSNTQIGTANVTLSSTPDGTEKTFSFGGIRTYKGELLQFKITSSGAGDAAGFHYQSTGDAYQGQYQGNSSGVDLTGTGIPASGADMYMKVNEFTNFGKLATTAGTRKFKLGQALSSTELALLIQESDSIL